MASAKYDVYLQNGNSFEVQARTADDCHNGAEVKLQLYDGDDWRTLLECGPDELRRVARVLNQAADFAEG